MPPRKSSYARHRQCANCGSGCDVEYRSFDLDLLPVRLCGVCAITIKTNPDMFDRMGGRRPGAKRYLRDDVR